MRFCLVRSCGKYGCPTKIHTLLMLASSLGYLTIDSSIQIPLQLQPMECGGSEKCPL